MRLAARTPVKAYGSLSTPQGGRARPSLTEPSGASNLIIPYGANDLNLQKYYYTAEKHYSTQKITIVTHALLCCACLSAEMNLPCTHVPPTPKPPPCRHRRLTRRHKTRRIYGNKEGRQSRREPRGPANAVRKSEHTSPNPRKPHHERSQ